MNESLCCGGNGSLFNMIASELFLLKERPRNDSRNDHWLLNEKTLSHNDDTRHNHVGFLGQGIS